MSRLEAVQSRDHLGRHPSFLAWLFMQGRVQSGTGGTGIQPLHNSHSHTPHRHPGGPRIKSSAVAGAQWFCRGKPGPSCICARSQYFFHVTRVSTEGEQNEQGNREPASRTKASNGCQARGRWISISCRSSAAGWSQAQSLVSAVTPEHLYHRRRSGSGTRSAVGYRYFRRPGFQPGCCHFGITNGSGWQEHFPGVPQRNLASGSCPI